MKIVTLKTTFLIIDSPMSVKPFVVRKWKHFLSHGKIRNFCATLLATVHKYFERLHHVFPAI